MPEWVQYSNNQFIKCNLEGHASLGLTVNFVVLGKVRFSLEGGGGEGNLF